MNTRSTPTRHVSVVLSACLAITLLTALTIPAFCQEGTLFVEGRRVGIGTQAPGGDLHIFGLPGTDVFNAIGPDATANAFNFGYSGFTFGPASGFFNVRPEASASAPNPALYFMTGNVDRMMIDNQGYVGVDLDADVRDTFDPAHPIHAQNSGAHLTSTGVWANASSRALKENIQLLDYSAAIAALSELEAVTFNYNLQPDDLQVGFIAEDVPDLVAMPGRTTLAPGEIVAVLTRVVQEQQRTIEQLSLRIERLSQNGSARTPQAEEPLVGAKIPE